VATTYVESQEVRVQLFALSNEVAHVDGARGPAEYADSVKESRKSKDPLRFRQASGEDGLQHDAADEPDEGKTLSDASQQLGAVKVLGRPCGGVQRVQPGSERCTSKASGEEQARIKFAQQQKRSRKRNGHKWESAPDDRRPNLVGFKSAYG